MANFKRQKKIVAVGGGTGVFTVLTGLKKHFKNLTAIVTMADDGGSTGTLRESFGILPPGDVRRAIVALADADNKILADLFNYRFKEGSGLKGHSFGNLMITALERITGDFEKAIAEASKILGVKGKVLPVTLEKTKLFAELENGKVIKGETNIDVPRHDGNLRIKKVWLDPPVKINPAARKAILEADALILGPGDLYTSLMPNLLTEGMRESLKKTGAKIIYFVNLMTKFGETNNFSVSDFIRVIEEYLGRNVVDYVVVNNKKPSKPRLKKYLSEKAFYVEIDKENLGSKPTLITANLIRDKGFVRHDPDKVAKVIRSLI